MNRAKQVVRVRLRLSGGRLRSTGAFLLSAVLVLLLGAHGAVATTTVYSDVSGVSVDFTGIQETNDDALGGPLFGAPTGFGDQLLFFPTSFSASSSGGGVATAGAQLQTMIQATGLSVIDTILIEEFGDVDLSGFGTPSTGAFVSMGGVVTVSEANGVPIMPVLIYFNAAGSPSPAFVPTFSPSDLFALPGDLGNTLWSGSVSIDVASVVPNATKVTLGFDNDLYAYSELGTTAIIQKKVVDGPAVVITVIPEPGTAALVGFSLLGWAVAARSRRG